MQLAARTAAWAKSGGWVNPYVTDGLVSMWDGEWNAGGGKHDASSCIDCVRGVSAVRRGNGSITVKENHFNFTPQCRYSSQVTDDAVQLLANGATLECVVSTISESVISAHVLFGWGFSLYRQSGALTFTCNDGQYRYVGNSIPTNKIYSASLIKEDSSLSVAATKLSVNGLVKNDFSKLWSDNYGVDKSISFGCMWYSGVTHTSNTNIYNVRLYNRVLTAAEIAANYAVDKERFNLT